MTPRILESCIPLVASSPHWSSAILRFRWRSLPTLTIHQFETGTCTCIALKSRSPLPARDTSSLFQSSWAHPWTPRQTISPFWHTDNVRLMSEIPQNHFASIWFWDSKYNYNTTDASSLQIGEIQPEKTSISKVCSWPPPPRPPTVRLRARQSCDVPTVHRINSPARYLVITSVVSLNCEPILIDFREEATWGWNLIDG